MFWLHDILPPKARKVVYGALGTVNVVEGALDGFNAGFMSARVQGIVLAVSSALGFGMAFGNVKPQIDPPPPH